MLWAEPLRMCVYGWISGTTINHQGCGERGVNQHLSEFVCMGGLAESL